MRHFIEGKGFIEVTDAVVAEASDKYVASAMWYRDALAERPIRPERIQMYASLQDSARDHLSMLRRIRNSERG